MPLPAPAEHLTAVVTGASAGLGIDLARGIAQRGYGVTLVARREEKLRELAQELSEAYGVRAEALACDLGDAGARDGLEADLAALDLTVGVLINNAGYGSGGGFTDLDREVEIAMIRLNCEGLVDLCARWAPGMEERGGGGILNVASIAGFQAIPRQATYSGTKAMVKAFSEALHEELRGSGVHVTALCPGPMKTEFIDVAEMGNIADTTPDFLFTSPEDVAEAGLEGLERNRRIVLPSMVEKVSATAGTHTPPSLMLRMMSRFYPVGK